MPEFQAELLSFLACPLTKQKMNFVSERDLSELNLRIKELAVRNEAGKLIEEKLSAALVTSDAKRIYPISSGIPVMLVEESIRN